ncbi:MAG: hypothetical protein ACPGYT_11855 [Nitrospirales bacterium]
MTPHQQQLNHRIAVVLGWQYKEVHFRTTRDDAPKYWWCWVASNGRNEATLPNWAGDLNEMWKLRGTLSERQQIVYGSYLLKVLDLYEFHKANDMMFHNYYQISQATAEQCAEAWLQVMEGE